MTEKMKLFLKAVQKNETMKTELDALNHELKGNEDAREINSRVIAIAKEHGFDLDASDLETPGNVEISDNEIAAVSGGVDSGCACCAAGGGGGKDDDGETMGCACVGYGQGGDAHNDNAECICPWVGIGGDIWG